MTDGYPTDDYKAGLRKLQVNSWYRYGLKVALGIGKELMDKYFDKDRFIVKITPIHATEAAAVNNFTTEFDFDVYDKFEKPLVDAGWQVIVFIPSHEEDADRITCGNSLIALEAEK